MKRIPPSPFFWPGAGLQLFWLTVLSLLALVGWQFYMTLTSELSMHSEQANRQFARMFTNENWSRLRPLLRLTADQEDAKTNPNLDEITAIVRRFIAGTDMVAVKIFNAQGLMLYATDPSQIGSDRSRSEGFLSAVRGKVTTELIHRDSISGFDGEMHDRDLVASYVPIRSDGAIEAVVEIYTDRTQALQEARTIGLKLVGFLALVLFVLLLPWLFLARRWQKRWQLLEVDRQTLSNALQQEHKEIAAATAARQKFLECVSDLLEQPIAQAIALAGPGKPVPQAPALANPVSSVVSSSTSADLMSILQTSHRRVHEFRKLVRVDGGSLEVSQSPFHLGDSIRQSVQRLETDMASAGCKLILYVAPGAEGICHGDAALLQEVVIYLLRLARLRMPAPGNIQLRVQSQAEGVLIDVIDGGVPMPRDQKEILADASVGESVMTKAAASDCEADNKIGLLLVSGLTRSMGGRIDVHTESGRGTSVHLWLPLMPQSESV